MVRFLEITVKMNLYDVTILGVFSWNYSFFSYGIYRSSNSLHVLYYHDFNDHDWLHETLVLNIFLFANREHIYIHYVYKLDHLKII